MTVRLTILCFLFFTGNVYAQLPDAFPHYDYDFMNEQIEDFLEENESEDFDYNTLIEHLVYLSEHPLDLNHADRESLQEMGLLTEFQIAGIIQYRKSLGDFISLYELQSVPEMNMEAIRRILPFVRVKGSLEDFQVPLGKMFFHGDNKAYIKWGQILEDQDGYVPPAQGEEKTGYLGDKNKIYLRVAHDYARKLQYGVTLEKDAGEEFFEGSNKQGFDFMSAHFYLKNYSKLWKTVALGDYSVSFGQGLILYNGFGYGKSSAVTDIKRTRRTINKYSSVQENNFMRGVGLTLGLADDWQLSVFGSHKNRDANILRPDTLVDDEFLAFSSLQTSGLHRTAGEIADKNALKETVAGGSLKYTRDKFHLALNAVYNHFDKPLSLRQKLYNRYYFSGDKLLNLSLDYAFLYRNFNFFGETGVSDNGSIATVNGVLIGLERNVQASIVHRHYPADFQTLNARPFGEGSKGNNEDGLYLGLEVNPDHHWKISTYFDIWKNPWLLFRADAPGGGHDFLLKIRYYKKRKTEIYLQLKSETKAANDTHTDEKITTIRDNNRYNLRLHFAQKVTASFELRTRAAYGRVTTAGETLQGFMIYQDVIFKDIGKPLSLSMRYALFDTDDYAVRFYAYENGMLYDVSVAPYYGRGSRFYINARYRISRFLTAEMRYSQSFWRDRKTIGTGAAAIPFPHKSELRAQLYLRF